MASIARATAANATAMARFQGASLPRNFVVTRMRATGALFAAQGSAHTAFGTEADALAHIRVEQARVVGVRHILNGMEVA